VTFALGLLLIWIPQADAQTPAQIAAVQAGCDRAEALLTAGYFTDAQTVLKSQLGVDNGNPCTTTLLDRVFAAETAKNPTGYFKTQVQVIRALEAAGFETEARNQAQALIEANPNRPIPADIRGLNQRLGWWRRVLGDTAPWFRTLLEALIAVLAAIAVALLAGQAASALYRRRWPATYTVGTITGIAADDIPRQTGLLEAELTGLSDRSAGPVPVRRAATDEQAFSLPAGITSAIPNTQLLMAVISLLDRLLPRRLTKVNLATLPGDSSRGVGLTVQVATRSGRSLVERTLWESDFFPLPGSPDAGATQPDADARLGRMLLPAAVWLAYQPKLQKGRQSTPASTGDWESYSHFAVAERAQRDGNLTQARRGYYKALDCDRTNTFALLNLAGLKLYRETPKVNADGAQTTAGAVPQGGAGDVPAQAPEGDDNGTKQRLDFARWLLVDAWIPEKTPEASPTQMRWLYLGAAYGLYSRNGDLASRFAQALWKQFEPEYAAPSGDAAVTSVALYRLLRPENYRDPEHSDQRTLSKPTKLDPKIRKQLVKSMRLPAWVLLQSAMVETNRPWDIDTHVDNAWWDSNTLYNLACFHARVASKGENAEANLSIAKQRLSEAIDRADEPELLLKMAESDPALDNVCADVEAAFHPKRPENDYSGDVQIGHGWGVRLHEAVKSGVLGQRNGQALTQLLGGRRGGSATGGPEKPELKGG